jgi:hypothetical protein
MPQCTPRQYNNKKKKKKKLSLQSTGATIIELISLTKSIFFSHSLNSYLLCFYYVVPQTNAD